MILNSLFGELLSGYPRASVGRLHKRTTVADAPLEFGFGPYAGKISPPGSGRCPRPDGAGVSHRVSGWPLRINLGARTCHRSVGWPCETNLDGERRRLRKQLFRHVSAVLGQLCQHRFVQPHIHLRRIIFAAGHPNSEASSFRTVRLLSSSKSLRRSTMDVFQLSFSL